ncbi:erg24, C-14 sterol reductase [Pichia californica]|uniref:Delta(14)-sterol reductase n=1 Tax=Pichia californica TaxID=460514 RepID=A0A9P6WMX2_9ASCO|nr:erg24, C-14 sterol reductase [[Candida] californica]KAG0689047.1 erg24, C-14 sterol reductase [[Candida] californica]
MSELNPITKKKDFGGEIGAIVLIVFLPLVTLFLYLACNEHYLANGLTIDITEIARIFNLEVINNWKKIFINTECWIFYLIWFFGLMILDICLPGKEMYGVELRDGTKLKYTINGLQLVGVLLCLLGSRLYLFGLNLPELNFLYDNFLGMMVTSWLFSIILSFFVFFTSYIPLSGDKKNGKGTKERILGVGGNSQNPIFDWFIGRELNPRIGEWDIKLFCELRPGLLLWFLLNLSSLQRQFQNLGYITNSMILVNVLQFVYIFDGVLNEEGCLTMIDITTDGFGFMLAFGDLCWVPFCYCLQSRYLVLNELNFSNIFVVIIVLIMISGFYIFKSSNNQKNEFRQGKLPHLKSIQTDRGTKLLIEGWWGISQHVNYFGDILIALSWCLPTGFNTPLTYFYVIYFSSLLLHRQKRDEEKCKNKYGKYWIEYEKKVPYKIIPYVY